MSFEYICMLFRYVSQNIHMLCAGYKIWCDTWLMLVAAPINLLQHDTRSCKVELWVGWRIRLLCGWHGRQRAQMRPVEHAVYEEIKRGGGLSADDFEVTVVEGGRAPPRRRLQRLAVFKASGTETNLLGNQQWRLHSLQNEVAPSQIEHSPPRVVNLMRFLESVWLKKRKGVGIVYKPNCRHIHTHSHMHTLQTRRTAAHGPVTSLDLKTRSLTRKGANLWLPGLHRAESKWSAIE